MILIADSGSTKSDWVSIDSTGVRKNNFETIGLNPYHIGESEMLSAIEENRQLIQDAETIRQVFFYGAGCSSREMCAIVQRVLSTVFPHAEVVVDHDQKGAAFATYDGRPCISCILGTGSNACFFDGKNTHEGIPSLAYILGDEASGSYFGKILLREFFYKKLPDEIYVDFEKTYHLAIADVLQHVYREPHANVYLAGFMKFISRFSDHPHILSWLVEGMKTFIDIHVKSFSEWKHIPVHFVGSVAYYFQHALQIAAAESGIHIGRIIKKPIDGLVDFHITRVFS